MKRLVVAMLVLALVGCIPIGFKSSTQMISPYAALPGFPAHTGKS